MVVLFTIVRFWIVDDAKEMSPPEFENVWSPVHVGVIPWESAGAASLRMNVVATPFTAERPIVAEGFAPRGVVIHVPPIAKHPPERLMPFVAVVDAEPPR